MFQKQKKAKRPRRSAPEQGGAAAFSALVKSACLALIPTLLCGAILLVAATALLLSTGDPGRYITPAGLAVLYISAFAGGAFAARFHKRRAPLLCGLFFGALMALIWPLVAWLLPHGAFPWMNGAARCGLCALFAPAAVVGALLAAREKKKKRIRR